MMYRAMSLFAMAAALAFVVATAQAADAPAKDANHHSGVVVSASNGTLVMTGHDKAEHSHKVSTDAKVMIKGAAGKLEDLKAGDHVKVTTDKDGNVTEIATVEPKANK